MFTSNFLIRIPFMLNIENLYKKYDNKVILNNISFEIPKNSIVGFLGPNGAGKTTLIRLLNCITLPDSGNILFDGHTLTDKDLQFIGYMPEEKGLYLNMTVIEQLIFFARLRGLKSSEAEKVSKYWLGKFDMNSYAKMQFKSLSKGNQQKIQFIITVLHNPKLLILDEPLSGLDPINSQLINDTILELHNQGTTIIFSTHRMEQVEELCNYIVMINKGQKVLDGEINSIINRYKVNMWELLTDKPISGINNYNTLNLDTTYDNMPNLYRYLINGNKAIANNIIQEILGQNHRIEYFREIKPTMKEIFFNLIEQNK
jgi:ABC-2 type transport system ATP-binding protein